MIMGTSSRGVTRLPPYGNSHLLEELNSIVERFTEKQTKLAASTGFSVFLMY